MKKGNYLFAIFAISMALAFTACSSSDDSVGGGGKDSSIDDNGGIKGKKLTELIVSGVQYQPYGDHYDNDGYWGDDDYSYYDDYRQDNTEYKFKIEYDSQNRLSKILLSLPKQDDVLPISIFSPYLNRWICWYYDSEKGVAYYYNEDQSAWYSKEIPHDWTPLDYDWLTGLLTTGDGGTFLDGREVVGYFLDDIAFLRFVDDEQWYMFSETEEKPVNINDVLNVNFGTKLSGIPIDYCDYQEILKVDYNSKVITIATRNWLYKKTNSWAYREHLPLSRQIRFDTNEKGYINKLSDYTIEYDNNGYLTGVKETNKMWTFAYKGNDLASAMSEDLATLNSTLLYYLTYPDNANKGELNVYMDVPRRKGYLSKNTINEVALLIAYQCGLFGKTTSRYKVISDLKDKTINIDQKIQNKNKSLKLKYKLSCVFE